MLTARPPKNFTHGDVLRWRRVGGLLLAEVEYAAGQRIHRHLHAHARFVLVLAGSITEIRGDQTSFAGYLRQARIEFARRELAGAAPLSDIAVAAGFCDQSHFSRSFKQYTGLTPAEYRLALQAR